ncbi:MAG TPA: hypothetical protein VH164_11595, partial [Ktedonobacteraceae bacterium]|nr:hypothetical protein [Ktedonobacteraceae bacterium]
GLLGQALLSSLMARGAVRLQMTLHGLPAAFIQSFGLRSSKPLLFTASFPPIHPSILHLFPALALIHLFRDFS